MDWRNIGSPARAAVLAGFALVAAACGGGGGGEPSTSQALRNSHPLIISGSIGDGPITGAEVTVLDSNGASVVAGVSDSSAGYRITVPVGTSFPITVTASGGTDLVSGSPSSFDLKAVLLDPTIDRVNVSPYSSLALALANCSNDVSPNGLINAWSQIDAHLSMGLDRTRVPDPTNGLIDANNVADIVLANEALAEVLRRTQAALAGSSAETDAATLIERVGCDLTDGMLDGVGGGADPRTAATFAAASADVMIELIAGVLQVNGSDATGAMDDAIHTILPGIDPATTTQNVPISEALLRQTRDTLAVVMTTLPDDALLDFSLLLGSTTAADAREAITAALTNADLVLFDGLAVRIATSDDSQVAAVSQAAQVQDTAGVPTISFAAAPNAVVAGGTARLSWSSSNALRCKARGDWNGRQPTEGTFITPALQTTRTYGLECVGLGGNASAQTSVQVAASAPPTEPAISLTANPASIGRGGMSSLTWSATNASTCVASGAWSGAKATSGTQSVGPLNVNSSFALACTGAGGTTSTTATVIVQQPAAAPTLTFSASPLSVASGGSSTLSWSSTNATSCAASNGWTGTKAVSGSTSTGALTAARTYTLACTGAGGTVTRTATVAISVPGAPTLTFTTAPTSVKAGAASQLTWATTNATNCTASGSWTGSRANSGTQSTGALNADASYTLTCAGAGGSASQTVSVDVIPAPTLTFDAVPASVQPGAATQLTWSATNATSCTASGGWSGSKATSGTQSSATLTANASFTMTCVGDGGSVSQTAAVTVLAAPTLTLSASPTGVQSGAASQLTWTSANASVCTASGGWSGSKAASGTESTGAMATSGNYTLTCTGSGGTVTKTASVTVLAPPTLSFAASPLSVQSGGSSQLTWSATNATSCDASGGWSGTKGTSGNQSTGALTANTSYTLTCSGSGGSVAQTTSVSVAAAAAPTLTLTASPASVQSGGSSQLAWTATNASSCTASGAWTGSKPASGTQSTGALSANASYTLTCAGSGGSIAKTAAISVTALAPTLSFSASPTSVQSGSASQLTWSTTNATSCAASGAWSGAKGTSGTQSTGALTANSSFTLTCAGASSNVAQTATVAITAGTPTVTLTANPKGVARNGTSTLSWSSTNVTSCTGSGSWSGTKATAGTQSVGPLTQDATYSLSCTGAAGNAVAMTTVSLREATLSWQAPTQNVDGSALTNLSGYKIYYGTSPASYTQTVSVAGASTSQWTLTLAPGTYYFAMTAVNTSGSESSKTGEVTKTIN